MIDAEAELNEIIALLRLGACELGGDNLASCPTCHGALAEGIAKAYTVGVRDGAAGIYKSAVVVFACHECAADRAETGSCPQCGARREHPAGGCGGPGRCQFCGPVVGRG